MNAYPHTNGHSVDMDSSTGSNILGAYLLKLQPEVHLSSAMRLDVSSPRSSPLDRAASGSHQRHNATCRLEASNPGARCQLVDALSAVLQVWHYMHAALPSLDAAASQTCQMHTCSMRR